MGDCPLSGDSETKARRLPPVSVPSSTPGCQDHHAVCMDKLTEGDRTWRVMCERFLRVESGSGPHQFLHIPLATWPQLISLKAWKCDLAVCPGGRGTGFEQSLPHFLGDMCHSSPFPLSRAKHWYSLGGIEPTASSRMGP